MNISPTREMRLVFNIVTAKIKSAPHCCIVDKIYQFGRPLPLDGGLLDRIQFYEFHIAV